MAQSSFSAQVSAWAAKSEKRIEAVFRQSAQTVAEEVKKTRDRGGHMRVDTGFLRASLMASTSMMPPIDPNARPVPGRSYPDGDGQIQLVIAGANIGDTIYLGFTANYAAHREYGTHGYAGDAFVRLTAQKWPRIVANSAKLIKSRVQG